MYDFSLLCLPCLPSIPFFLPCLKHRCFSHLFKLSTSFGGCLMFLCALHPLLCLLLTYYSMAAFKLLICFCASQQNCPWTQHTFPLPTPAPFSLALSSHYSCWLEFFSANSVLDPFPTCLGFCSSNSILSFVPYCSIMIVKVNKWPAFVNTLFLSDLSCTFNVFFLETLIFLCFNGASFLISSCFSPLLLRIIWEVLFSNIDFLLCFFRALSSFLFLVCTCLHRLIPLD